MPNDEKRRSEVGGRRSEVGRHERLDVAIDHAVREMLDVEAPADLRTNVIARIEKLPAASYQLPGASFQLPVFSFQRFGVLRFAAVVTAAAALVLMVLFVRSAERPARPPIAHGADQQLQTDVPARAAVDTTATPRQAATGSPRIAATGSTTEAAGVTGGVAHAASTATSSAPGIDPLKTIAPIQVAPIAQSNIAPEPIDVRPLNPINEMQIAPLNPPEGRD